MKENNLNIEMNIADAIIEKPIGFKVGNRHLCLYPPTLGKTYLLSRLFKALGVNTEIIKVNPYLESLRLCKEKKGIVCRILSYHTLCRKEEILNDVIVSKRSDFLMKRLNDEELSQLFILSTSWDDAEIYIKYFGLEKEQKLRKKISKLKNKNGKNISFGGLSTYGALIDFACQRYGWKMDYVVWGISYVNLQMLMADAITSVYLSNDEIKKLRIHQDKNFINGDDPNNIQKIKSMNWN